LVVSCVLVRFTESMENSILSDNTLSPRDYHYFIPHNTQSVALRQLEAEAERFSSTWGGVQIA
jgi:hypothetical protein